MRFICFLVGSAGLIGMMLLLRKILRDRIPPGILYALWLIPAVRLLLPFTLIPLPVLSEPAENVGMLYERAAADPVDMTGNAQDTVIAGKSETAETLLPADLTDSIQKEQKAKSLSNSWEVDIQNCLLCIWLSGSILCGGYVLFVNLRLKRSLKQLEVMPEKSPVPVFILQETVSPCLFGFFHPCILLSEQTAKNRELCRQALLHEETHYRQKDHIWTTLRIFLCILYWWEPLVWLGAACAREDAEFACDAKALKGASLSEKKAYGYALLELAQGAQRSDTLIRAITPISAKGKNLKKRLENIVSENPKTRLWPLSVCLLLFLFLCGFCFPAQRARAEEMVREPNTGTADNAVTVGTQDSDTRMESASQENQAEENQTKENQPKDMETEEGIRVHPQEHRAGYREPNLNYTASASWLTNLTDRPEEQARIENLANRALRELYDLTGYQVETCFYGYNEIGMIVFSRTEEDMAHSRVFYTYNMGEKDGFDMIPSIDVVNARSVWYSDVQQIALPEQAESMEKEELAVWFLEHSPLCPDSLVVKIEPLFESGADCLKLTMEDGTFYEVEIDMEILALDNIYGPYPEDTQH